MTMTNGAKEKRSLDRRVIKTKKSIKEALMKLMRENQINKISVTDIARTANINRATFYLHYNSVVAVFEEIQNDFASIFMLSEISFDKDSLTTKSEHFFAKMSSSLGANGTVVRFILSSTKSSEIVSTLKNSFQEAIKKSFIAAYPEYENDKMIQYDAIALTSALTDMYLAWHRSTNRGVTIEQLGKTASNMTLGFVERILKRGVIEE